MFGINKYFREKKRRKILSEPLRTGNIISTVDKILRNEMPLHLEYSVKVKGPYSFRVSTDYFINNAYVFVVVGYNMFAIAKIKEFVQLLFSKDKIIIVTDKTNQLLKSIPNAEIIEIDTIKEVDGFFNDTLDVEIKDYNYLYKKLKIKMVSI